MRSILAIILASATTGGAWMVCPEALRDGVAERLASGEDMVVQIGQDIDLFMRSLDGPPGDISPDRPSA